MTTRQNLRRFFVPGLLASALALAPMVPSQLQSRAASANALPAGIAEPFVTSWQSLNGADLLGPPVSPPVQIDGHLMQFFAYGALISDAGGAVTRYGWDRRWLNRRTIPSARWQGAGLVPIPAWRRLRSIPNTHLRFRERSRIRFTRAMAKSASARRSPAHIPPTDSRFSGLNMGGWSGMSASMTALRHSMAGNWPGGSTCQSAARSPS